MPISTRVKSEEWDDEINKEDDSCVKVNAEGWRNTKDEEEKIGGIGMTGGLWEINIIVGDVWK